MKRIVDERPVSYVLNEDKMFDVSSLRNIDGTPFIQIYDKTTNRVTDFTTQSWQTLSSNTKDELMKILDALIVKNAKYSRATFIEDLMNRASWEIESLKESLHLLNFKGTVQMLPSLDTRIGDMAILETNGSLYICCEIDKVKGPKWKRLLSQEDLSEYYTKIEFDEKYNDRFSLVSAFVDDKLNFTLSACQEMFVLRSEVDARLSSQQEYEAAINHVNQVMESQQQLVDNLVSQVNEMHNEFNSLVSGLPEWKSQQESILENKIVEAYGYASSFCDNISDRLNQSTSELRLALDELALLSGAYIKAKNGDQKVLEAYYEA